MTHPYYGITPTAEKPQPADTYPPRAVIVGADEHGPRYQTDVCLVAPDEPLFILHGSNPAAVATLKAYAQAAAAMGAKAPELDEVMLVLDVFTKWRDAHQDLMRVPD